MSPAELDELERMHTEFDAPVRGLMMTEYIALMAAVPRLIAKLRAADALADALDETADLELDKHRHIRRRLDAFRKAGTK